MLLYLGEQQGEVGAAKDDGVDEGVLVEEFLEGVLDKVVGTWFVEFVVLD